MTKLNVSLLFNIILILLQKPDLVTKYYSNFKNSNNKKKTKERILEKV